MYYLRSHGRYHDIIEQVVLNDLYLSDLHHLKHYKERYNDLHLRWLRLKERPERKLLMRPYIHLDIQLLLLKIDLILFDIAELAPYRIYLVGLFSYNRTEYLIELRKINVTDQFIVVDRLNILEYFFG